MREFPSMALPETRRILFKDGGHSLAATRKLMSQIPPAAPGDLERLRIREERRKPARRRRRWPLYLLGIIVLAVIGAMLTRPPEVTVATAKAGGGSPAEAGGAVLTANGYVEARHQTSIAARTTGRLAEVYVEEGDPVGKGQVVARLIADDQRAFLAQAEANLAVAAAKLEQARVADADARRRSDRRAELLAQKQVSEEESEGALAASESARAERLGAEANVKVAKANLETARLELDKTEITAPFDGVVLRKDAEVGEIVGPIMTSNTARAGAVVTIADMKTLEVGIDVNETYIARIRQGMPADVVLDAHPEVHFPAEVRAVFPSADRDKATVPVRVRFLLEDERIRPDLGAKVTFLERRPTEQVTVVKKSIRIPPPALREKDGATMVLIVREGKAEVAEVTVGERQADSVEILTGVSEGDQVIVGAVKGRMGRIRGGTKVRVAS
jgi:RND family efflux transporter MFP subunit